MTFLKMLIFRNNLLFSLIKNHPRESVVEHTFSTLKRQQPWS